MTSHRRWLKERRAEKIRLAQEVWKDEDYGIKIAETRHGARLTWDVDQDSFVALMALHQLGDVVLARMESDIVTVLRGEGVAWDEIGWALGITGQAAKKRHPAADRNARTMFAESASV
jgi:hypothetical protein